MFHCLFFIKKSFIKTWLCNDYRKREETLVHMPMHIYCIYYREREREREEREREREREREEREKGELLLTFSRKGGGALL